MASRSRTRSPLPQLLCENCKKLEELVRQWRSCRNDDSSFESPLEIRLHDNYQHVETNASNGCPACRAIRRSLLQHQITWKAARELSKCNDAVYAKLCPKNDPVGSEFGLGISVHCKSDPKAEDLRSVQLLLRTSNEDFAPRDLRNNADDNGIIDQIQSWMSCCHADHNNCGNLQWSQKNPTHLIQILQDGGLRLIDPPEKPLLQYAALSYSWGDRKNLSVDEVSEIEHAKTRRKRSSDGWQPNFEKRRNRFHVSDLPLAMRDATRLSKRLGIEYIWIDQVCIGDAADWNHEASKMHEIYGNSHVTICACSTEKATDGLFHRRSAWDYPESQCTIEGLRLIEYDMSLKEVRLKAPIFKRAWILQEERLSPRTIYWCSQRVYWSCLESRRTEMARQDGERGAVPALMERHVNADTLLPPQTFMKLRWKGETNRLHDVWLELVQDFAKRAIYDSLDRFPAMSGLAAQYLLAFTHDKQVIDQQEYLAGLWRGSFARDLTWTVKTARDRDTGHNGAPCWSWASLPSESPIETKHHFQTSPYFELKESSHVKSSDGVFEVVKRGSELDAVRVQGRLRRFAASNSIEAKWEDVMKSEDDDTEFRLDHFGMTNVVAKHVERGKILSYEANKEQVVAQLDYAEDYGDMRDLWCLEVGKSSMLILVRANQRRAFGIPSYVRIGAGHGFRENFFNDNVPVQKLDLVARQVPPTRSHLRHLWLLFVAVLIGLMAAFCGRNSRG